MPRASDADLDVAILWLEANEGDSGEAEACQRIADFLKRQQAKREREATVRRLVNETGASASLVRKALNKMETTT